MAEIFMAYFNGGDPNGPYDTWEPILQAPPSVSPVEPRQKTLTTFHEILVG